MPKKIGLRDIRRCQEIWMAHPENPPREIHNALYPWGPSTYEGEPTEMSMRVKKLCDFMVDYLSKRWKEKLDNRIYTLEEIEQFSIIQPFHYLRELMWSIIDIWVITYSAPMPSLASIADSSESVHKTLVLKNTNHGISILSDYPVPPGQKTLAEIRKAWSAYPPEAVDKVMANMKDWASRKQVMRKDVNVYKNVLRGLWAKISKNPDLIQRLWEECNDAIGYCSDGQVSRLVNVLSGFEDDFSNNMSPMQYFQINIALISNKDAPLSFKIENAIKLMDEVQMPVDDRQVWLDAF